MIKFITKRWRNLRGDVIDAGKKFGEAELMYPQSVRAPESISSIWLFFSRIL